MARAATRPRRWVTVADLKVGDTVVTNHRGDTAPVTGIVTNGRSGGARLTEIIVGGRMLRPARDDVPVLVVR